MGVEWKWPFLFLCGNICMFIFCVFLWFVLQLVLQFVREYTVPKVNY